MDDVEIKDQRYKCCELSGTPHDHIGMSQEPKEISEKNGTPREVKPYASMTPEEKVEFLERNAKRFIEEYGEVLKALSKT